MDISNDSNQLESDVICVKSEQKDENAIFGNSVEENFTAMEINDSKPVETTPVILEEFPSPEPPIEEALKTSLIDAQIEAEINKLLEPQSTRLDEAIIDQLPSDLIDVNPDIAIDELAGLSSNQEANAMKSAEESPPQQINIAEIQQPVIDSLLDSCAQSALEHFLVPDVDPVTETRAESVPVSQIEPSVDPIPDSTLDQLSEPMVETPSAFSQVNQDRKMETDVPPSEIAEPQPKPEYETRAEPVTFFQAAEPQPIAHPEPAVESVSFFQAAESQPITHPHSELAVEPVTFFHATESQSITHPHSEPPVESVTFFHAVESQPITHPHSEPLVESQFEPMSDSQLDPLGESQIEPVNDSQLDLNDSQMESATYHQLEAVTDSQMDPVTNSQSSLATFLPPPTTPSQSQSFSSRTQRVLQSQLMSNDKSRLNLREWKRRAMKSTIEYNQHLNQERREERSVCMDLQTFTLHYPVGLGRNNKMLRRNVATGRCRRVGPQPVATMPGQYQDWFYQYRPEELKYMPVNTVLYGPVVADPSKLPPLLSSAEEGSPSGSDSSSESSDDSLRGASSSSDSSSDSEVDGPPPMPTLMKDLKSKPNAICKECSNQLNKQNVIEELVTCSECENSIHPSCLQLTTDMVDVIKSYPWQCMHCKTCVHCSKPHNEDRMMFCDKCDRGYHTFCVGLKNIPTGKWVCRLCAQCAQCGVTTPGDNGKAQWQHETIKIISVNGDTLRRHQLLCQSCHKNRKTR